MEAGLLFRSDPNWIACAPPLVTTIEQAEEMIGIFTQCVTDEIEDYKGIRREHEHTF